MPTAEFVGEPLAVTLCRLRPYDQAMDITVSLSETGIPLPEMFIVPAVKAGFIGFAVTETGRAYGSAVTTAQTTVRDFFPAWVLEVGKQWGLQVIARQLALLPDRGLLHGILNGLNVSVGCRLKGKSRAD